jgi:hypothetical protein
MDFPTLVSDLGRRLGLSLNLEENGSCGVTFGDDEIGMELVDGRLFLISHLASSLGHETDCARLLNAAHMGLESGFANFGIDEAAGEFTLTRTLEGSMSKETFEKALVLFVRSVRYWKAWLTLPASEQSAQIEPFDLNFTMLRI